VTSSYEAQVWTVFIVFVIGTACLCACAVAAVEWFALFHKELKRIADALEKKDK